MIQPTENYAVVDIETHTPTGKPDPTKDELRYVGFKAYSGRKVCYHYSQKTEIEAALNYFKYLVGHNLKNYDIPVLERYGYNFYGKIIVDTYHIADSRCKSMMYIDLNQGQRSLKALLQLFNLEHQKGEFDYSKLVVDRLEGSDYEDLVKYLYGDLDGCDDLFKFFYDFFYGFKEYMSESNQEKLAWLISKPGGTAYKCICNMAGLKEEYNKEATGKNKAYDGGFVSEPYVDFVEG